VRFSVVAGSIHVQWTRANCGLKTFNAKNICEIIYFAMADVNVFLFLLLLRFVGLTVMNFAFCDVFMLRSCISVPANGGSWNPVFF